MKLSKATRLLLRKASRKAITESVSLLKPRLKKSRWIAIQNRYVRNTVKRLHLDSNPGGHLNHLHLAEYVSASGPLHCTDGWALLGRAMDCHCRRDYESARHFAYYAELRATFSLLATEGIGIFAKEHFVIDAAKKCFLFRGPTHQIVWPVLEYWASLTRAADLLGEAIQVSGVNLRQWLNHFQNGGNLHAVGSKWLRNWGLDLRFFLQDRETRNEASYRPTLIRPGILDVTGSADFICALWSLCEPSAHSPFENLDRHLLRIALEDSFKGITGTTPKANRSLFRTRVESLVSQVILDVATHDRWVRFLTRAIDPNDAVIISKAGQTDSNDTPGQHLQMISRSALLLRVATAANSVLLKDGSISGDEIEFWWSALGEDRGLWEASNPPSDLKDLWADAETAVQAVRDWTNNTSNADKTFMRWRQDKSYEISVLGGCERIALWGLNL